MKRSAFVCSLLGVFALPACSNTPPAAPPTETTATGDFTPRNQVFDCNGRIVIATFDGENATVLVDGVTHVLPGVPAGSGAKFMDDAGNTLWTKGADEGLWTPAGGDDVSCSATGAQ